MSAENFRRAFALWPVTLVVLVLSLVGFALPFFEIDYRIWRFYPPQGLAHNFELWRLLTPTFLHFGVMHIVFNGLWLWELGRRLEYYLGSLIYSIVFVLMAIAANFAQYYDGLGTHFGGLSGVIYGLLGFLMVARFCKPHPALKIPDGIFIFMLAWLVLGYLGVLDFLVQGKIGNGAHLGGLIMGLILGVAFFFKDLLKRQ